MRAFVSRLLFLLIFCAGADAWAQSESKITLPPLGRTEWMILWGVLASAVLALVYGASLVRRVIRRDPGPEEMVRVARY
jgi:hypothetical protein